MGIDRTFGLLDCISSEESMPFTIEEFCGWLCGSDPVHLLTNLPRSPVIDGFSVLPELSAGNSVSVVSVDMITNVEAGILAHIDMTTRTNIAINAIILMLIDCFLSNFYVTLA
jgi:hypothetical protein